MKKLLLSLVGILCSMSMWAATVNDLVVIDQNYTLIADDVTSNGTVGIGKSVLFGDNHFLSDAQGLSVSTGKGSSTINGVSHLNSLRVKNNVKIAFKVSGSCHVKVYHQSNSTRTIIISSEYKLNEGDVVGSYSTTTTEADIEGAQTVYVYSIDSSNESSGNGDLYIAGIEITGLVTPVSSIATKSQVTEAKKWDFNTADVKTTLAGTMNALEDHTYWSAVSSNQTYYQKTISKKELTIDGTNKIAVTEGLYFTSSSTNRIGFNLSGGNLRFANSDCTITIPNLLPGDKVIVVGGRNGSSGERGFSFTNVDVASHTSSDNASWTAIPELTVQAAGNVTITSINGVNITSIEIVPGPGTGAAKLSLADDKEYKYDAAFTGNVTINRTFAADGWYSLCLPFDLDDVSMFSKVAEYVENDGETYKFNTVTSMVAGKPYIVQVDATLANPVFEGVTVSKDVAADTSAEFKGALNPVELTAGCDGIGSGTTINPLNAGTLKGFRAYFQTSGASKISKFVVDNETSSIDNIDAVKTVADGKYLVNGKVVIVKGNKVYTVAGVEK